MYPWSVPEEMVWFVCNQFDRFNINAPNDLPLDKILDYVMWYVIDKRYYPNSSQEAVYRYDNPGLTEPEKIAVLAPLEIKLKIQLRASITIDQMHLAVWAGFMFCWSSEGEEHVSWYDYIERKAQIIQDFKDQRARDACSF